MYQLPLEQAMGPEALWFSDDRGAKLRPTLYKTDVTPPERSGGAWRVSVWYWRDGRMFRVTRFLEDVGGWRPILAEALEADYQRRFGVSGHE